MEKNMTSTRWGRAFRAAFPATIPVMTGFLCLGLAYGVLMQTKGYGPLWSTLMSAIAFGGSMQYVAITLLTTAFDPLQAFLLSVMVNARHIFYGLALLDKYKGLGKIRAFLVYVLCDETFSLVSTVEPPEGVERRDPADPLAPLLAVSGEAGAPRRGDLSGKGAASGHDGAFGGVLPQKRQLAGSTPWCAGGHRRGGGDGTPLEMGQCAPAHRWRHGGLYAVGAAGICVRTDA